MNVDLSDGVARSFAGVGYLDGDFEISIRRDLRVAELKACETERRVAKSVTERIKRFGGKIPVTRGEAGGVFGLVGEIVIVIERLLADGAGPGDGQLAAGIDVAEQNIGDRVTANRAGIPGFQNCGNVFRSPANIEGPAVQQNEHERFSGGGDGF